MNVRTVQPTDLPFILTSGLVKHVLLAVDGKDSIFHDALPKWMLALRAFKTKK